MRASERRRGCVSGQRRGGVSKNKVMGIIDRIALAFMKTHPDSSPMFFLFFFSTHVNSAWHRNRCRHQQPRFVVQFRDHVRSFRRGALRWLASAVMCRSLIMMHISRHNTFALDQTRCLLLHVPRALACGAARAGKFALSIHDIAAATETARP